eukprot:Tamp_23277.p2 GENE.Tamp_23277~~Tamp_23277.p2  ORF type:complete len:116 (+),score=41.73 Tamp_23277:56-403(+)
MAESEKKTWQPSRTDWQDPAAAGGKGVQRTAQDVEELTKDVNVEGKRDALLASSAAAEEATKEGKALEDKLGNLKDQLTDLRSAIKSFETEFDQRLDACLQQIVNHKATLEENAQ